MSRIAKRWLPRVAAAAVLVAASFWWAHAAPGGTTRDSLSFDGTLLQNGQVPASPVDLTFRFTDSGGTVLCSPVVSGVSAAIPDGAVHVEIPLDTCPGGMIDGRALRLDVLVGSTTVVSGATIGAVPYAKYADHHASPNCPAGYTLQVAAPGVTECVHFGGGKVIDAMVKVGAGPTAFWIDEYEDNIASAPDGSGTTYGAGTDDYPSTFPDNGEATTPLYAVSNVLAPASAYVTWYQANAACRASGKRLPTAAEWLQAASGTPDTSNNNCTVNASGPASVVLTACQSRWGAVNMLGNLAEWTTDWQAMLGDGTPSATWTGAAGSNYGADTVTNVASSAQSASGTTTGGLPAVGVRGGSYASSSTGAGIFTVSYAHAPSFAGPAVGFRCVIAP